jgi:hypothetical protein
MEDEIKPGESVSAMKVIGRFLNIIPWPVSGISGSSLVLNCGSCRVIPEKWAAVGEPGKGK